MNEVNENNKIGWVRRLVLALLDGVGDELDKSQRPQPQLEPTSAEWIDTAGQERYGPGDGTDPAI